MEALILSAEDKAVLDAGFRAAFSAEPERYFSAPGRTEIGGNHTDHQRGRVLAAAVNLDTRAAVRVNGTNIIRILSKGYPLCQINVTELTPVESEINSTPALIRGVAARFNQMGCKVQGFDAYCESTVLPGSGLSSSAAYEVLIGTIINGLFFDGKVSQPEIAMIGQYAENVFFGKPCGLMDQMASAVGNLVTIDFFDKENPVIEPVAFDFGDRAVMRAIHFYQENARVPKQVAALKAGDFEGFLALVKQSGYSSYMYLQNVIPAGYKEHQDVAVSLALCEHYLAGRGAYRVHGGGFAGTVQAFVPFDILEEFRNGIDAVLGEGACHVLSIRPQGGVEMEAAK